VQCLRYINPSSFSSLHPLLHTPLHASTGVSIVTKKTSCAGFLLKMGFQAQHVEGGESVEVEHIVSWTPAVLYSVVVILQRFCMISVTEELLPTAQEEYIPVTMNLRYINPSLLPLTFFSCTQVKPLTGVSKIKEMGTQCACPLCQKWALECPSVEGWTF
jgi:hypothetical protein